MQASLTGTGIAYQAAALYGVGLPIPIASALKTVPFVEFSIGYQLGISASISWGELRGPKSVFENEVGARRLSMV
jgi:hypothetical protein